MGGVVDRTTAFLREHAESTRYERDERERDLRAREEEAASAVERTRTEAAAVITEQAERMREQGRDLERLPRPRHPFGLWTTSSTGATSNFQRGGAAVPDSLVVQVLDGVPRRDRPLE